MKKMYLDRSFIRTVWYSMWDFPLRRELRHLRLLREYTKGEAVKDEEARVCWGCGRPVTRVEGKGRLILSTEVENAAHYELFCPECWPEVKRSWEK